MDGIERLYYALGNLAYAVAISDGEINHEEKEKLHDIVIKETKCHNDAINVSEIIFHLLQKKQLYTAEDAYRVAMKEMTICSNYLTEDMKVEFAAVLEKVARAFGSYTTEEQQIIERFRIDMDCI